MAVDVDIEKIESFNDDPFGLLDKKVLIMKIFLL